MSGTRSIEAVASQAWYIMTGACAVLAVLVISGTCTPQSPTTPTIPLDSLRLDRDEQMCETREISLPTGEFDEPWVVTVTVCRGPER